MRSTVKRKNSNKKRERIARIVGTYKQTGGENMLHRAAPQRMLGPFIFFIYISSA